VATTSSARLDTASAPWRVTRVNVRVVQKTALEKRRGESSARGPLSLTTPNAPRPAV
jgi:hypothetical protein